MEQNIAMIPPTPCAVDEGANPLEQLQQLGGALISMMPALQKLSTLLPKETLQWKLKLITQGCEYVRPDRLPFGSGSQPSVREAALRFGKPPFGSGSRPSVREAALRFGKPPFGSGSRPSVRESNPN
eukprot:1183223-Prorocentrum_minimum.AAC.3